jgi:restriction endonuclease Mrr
LQTNAPERDASAILTELLAQNNTTESLYDRQTDEVVTAVKNDIVFVDQRLLHHVAAHPGTLHELDPRRFEDLVAEIWHRRGYTVKLTPETRDGGKDIYAVHHSTYGDIQYVIGCKRYALDRPVGVEIVRALYGVTEAETATMGFVATTSYFSKDAHEVQRKLAHRITLAAYNELKEWRKDATRGTIVPAAKPPGTVIH